MSASRLALVALLLVGPAAPGAVSLRDEEKGTYLGALFAPLPQGRTGGVLVTHVLPDSPAARAGLLPQDVLLRYDGSPIRDCEHFVRLIRDDRPGHAVTLVVRRGGRERKVEATLAVGPVLRVAGPAPAPSSVSVAATPLEGGKMRVTIVYPSNAGPQKVTYQGASAEIDSEVGKLPRRERDLVRAALERIRALSVNR
jgi:serine protease Do